MTARRTGLASVATLAALTLTVGGVHALAPDWSRRMGVDVWNLPCLEAERVQKDALGDELEAHGERTFRQIEASERVAAELAAGRVSLADAVVELERVNSSRSALLAGQRAFHPDAGDDRELVARYAVSKALRIFRDDSTRRTEVMPRLEAEYRALVGKEWTGDE
jgi:hypothetical protein